MIKVYAIGEKYHEQGHGYNQQLMHITPKNTYMGDLSFHPVFETLQDANDYIKKNELEYFRFPIELQFYKP